MQEHVFVLPYECIVMSLQRLVTVGRDFSCSVWSGNQLAMGLKWNETKPNIGEKTYRYMGCRSVQRTKVFDFTHLI